MAKKNLGARTSLGPVPPALVSCGNSDKANVLTVAWTGIVNSFPPIVYVSVQRSRYSHGLIAGQGEFVINIPTAGMVYETDWCGVHSGRDVDKFERMGFTVLTGERVACPSIKECPINLECKVIQTVELPSHDMFIGEVLNVRADEELVDEKGVLHMEKADLLGYMARTYVSLKEKPLGIHGCSVKSG